MKRIPIGLTDAQHERLRDEARRRHRSVGSLVREAVDQVYAGGEADRQDRRARARRSFGRFHSGRSDISERHDEYLGELPNW